MQDWVIVSACPVGEAMRRYITPGCRLVACDAGWRNLQKLGLTPDLVVGDFDSAPPPPGGPHGHYRRGGCGCFPFVIAVLGVVGTVLAVIL